MQKKKSRRTPTARYRNWLNYWWLTGRAELWTIIIFVIPLSVWMAIKENEPFIVPMAIFISAIYLSRRL